MSGMNPPQRLAVEYIDGPLLVLAGAGSGKTRVITEKIAHLVQRGHVQAQHIAAITFTNKAAREMRERVGRRLRGEQAEGLTISTFHSLDCASCRWKARARACAAASPFSTATTRTGSSRTWRRRIRRRMRSTRCGT
jgi:superfamily I DNA/RNA helicase